MSVRRIPVYTVVEFRIIFITNLLGYVCIAIIYIYSYLCGLIFLFSITSNCVTRPFRIYYYFIRN